MSDPVRDEAERLVAAAIGAFSTAARGLGPMATGTAECCVCPVCRLIAAMRDPSPELAERLAASAGDLAVAVAGMLRAFGSEDDRTAADGDPWHEATTEPPPPPPPPAPRKAAKKAVKPRAAS